MYKPLSISLKSSLISIGILLLSACGGGGGGSSDPQAGTSVSQGQPQTQQFIAGAGIKGPLAFASVKLFSMDTGFDQLYNPSRPLALASTNAFAQIDGLPVPLGAEPPFILVIDGTNAIDLNTGVPPVISKLVTIITREQLNAGRSVYATPYTTLIYHMLELESQGPGLGSSYQVPGSGAVQQATGNDGLVSIEVEDFDKNTDKGGHSWKLASSSANFSGAGALEAGPNTGTSRNSSFKTKSPRLDYQVNFVKTGLHYVWIRAVGASTSDDSFHIGLDGETSSTSKRVSKFKALGWSNRNTSDQVVTLDVKTAGEHTLNIWMREDGTVLDKVVLSSNRNYLPAGAGPLPNSRINATTVVSSVSGILAAFNQQVITSAGFGMPASIDMFTTPPIISSETIVLQEQQLAVTYRAAIEALSTSLHVMSSLYSSITRNYVSTDTLLQQMASGLYNDGDLRFFTILELIGYLPADPMDLKIANTQYQVRDIIDLLVDERALVGTNGTVNFLTKDIVVDLQPVFTEAAASGSSQDEGNSNESPEESSDPVPSAASSVAVAGLITTLGLNSSQLLFNHDFDIDNPGVYTEADLSEYWGTRSSPSVRNKSVRIVQDPNGTHGQVMDVIFKKGGVNYDRFVCCSGVQWKTPLKGKDELYFSYEVMFEDGFDFVLGGKLPGLYGGEFIGGGKRPTGYDGWSGRMMFHAEGTADQYIYHSGMSSEYGEKHAWKVNGKRTHFTPGQWHTIEIRYVMNKPGSSDGIIQTWLDGKLTSDVRDFRFRKTDKFSINGIIMTTYFGGHTKKWAPPKDQHVFFDNFTVTTVPVTH